MLKRCLVLILAVAFVVPFAGCGIQNVFSGKEVPPLEGYSKVVITPFEINKPTGKYETLPTMLSYGIGTKLGLLFNDRSWFFDQSKEVTPVTDKMKELNVSKNDLYQNPESAAKLAKAFDANLIIVGQFMEPKFTMEKSSKREFEMSEPSQMRGVPVSYYSIYQTAMIKSRVKVIDVSTSKVIWEGKISGYKKYRTRYRAGHTEKFEREDTMYADIRKEYVNILTTKLYPEKAVKQAR